MQLKKKFVVAAIAAAMFIGATAPVSALSVCDIEPFSFDTWFIHTFLC